MRLVLLLGAVLWAAPVWADREPASSSGNELVASATLGRLAFSDSGSVIRLGVAYNFLVTRGVHLGVKGDLNRVGSAGGSVTTLSLLGGPVLNFPFDGRLSTAFFVEAFVGIGHTSVGSNTDIKFEAAVGKRMPLTGALIYRPSFGISKTGSQSLFFVFEVLALSLIF